MFVHTWHWAFSGFLFGCIMLALVYLGGYFGLSSSYRSICSIAGAGKFSPFFHFNWRSEIWHLFLVAGIILGGAIAHTGRMMQGSHDVPPLPPGLFETFNPISIAIIFTGALLSGFGSRYAGGCTSGHFISGISNGQLPSVITLIFFMVGGILTTLFIIPYLPR